MSRHVHPALRLELTPDEQARQDFTSAVRAHVLNDMAAGLKRRWTGRIAPRLPAPARDGADALAAMRPDPYFRFYTALRVHAQDMVWASAAPAVAREAARLEAAAHDGPATLELDPALRPAPYVAADVHRMPGSYTGGEGIAAGALYENGLAVFGFGLMGEELDDIGTSIARWLTRRFPAFRPAAVLDLGCSVGHQTLPWARAYPDAAVTGIDVAAPGLRYAQRRANAYGVKAHFAQRDARATGYPDASFDLVFSSMFLHELPPADVRRVVAECRRLLRPGGLMLHYELPPNAGMDPFDAAYLDWDATWNAEPFYKRYRDLDPRAVAAEAGFAPERYLRAVVPSLSWYGADAADADAVDGDTGRLAEGVKWFVWGAWA